MRCIVCRYFTGTVDLVFKVRTDAATSAPSVSEAQRSCCSVSSGLALRNADAGECVVTVK